MKTIQIPDTDLVLAPAGMGCVKAGLKWDGPEADRIFDAYYDAGGNLYDTARVYSDWIGPERGRSERVLGDWLARSGKRNHIVICTKGGHPDMTVSQPDLHKSRLSPEEMRYDVEASLRTLRTDHIDIYIYHRDDETRPVSQLIDTMEEFVKEGKIRYYGCSNWSTGRMREADAYCKEKGLRGFVANQALYNIGEAAMNPPADDTLQRMDAEMRRYHKENPGNLAMPYMSNCGGFFHKLLKGGREAAASSEYYTEGNLQVFEKLKGIMEEHGCTMTQAVLGFFTGLPFAALPLYGPRNEEDIREVMKTFQIHWGKTFENDL